MRYESKGYSFVNEHFNVVSPHISVIKGKAAYHRIKPISLYAELTLKHLKFIIKYKLIKLKNSISNY